MKPLRKHRIMLRAIFVLAALALLAMTAFATSTDYGVNTGASAQTTCGGTSGPSCTISYNGHSASWTATNNDGSASYSFDDYDCTAVLATNGAITIGGEECDSVTATPTATPEPDPAS